MMNQRLLIRSCCLFLALVLLTGCWNRRELNDLSIVMALGLDKSQAGYNVSVQLVNAQEIASKGGSGYSTPVTVYSAEGDTIFNCLRKLTTKLNRKMYLSHIRAIIFGEELARSGIRDALDFLSRDHEMRTDFYVSVAQGMRAVDVLSTLTPLEKIPANKMYSTLEVSAKSMASISGVTIDELLRDLMQEGANPALTAITTTAPVDVGSTKSNVEKVIPNSVILYPGMAAFRNDKLVGWLNEDESIGYNLTQGKVDSTIVRVACPEGGKLGVELIRTRHKIRAVTYDGKLTLRVELDVEGNIGDVECPMKITDPGTFDSLERKVEEAVEHKIRAVVDKTQKKLKTDIIGFGEAVHRDQRHLWKEVKSDWLPTYSKTPVEIAVKAELRRMGTVTDPIPKKQEG